MDIIQSCDHKECDYEPYQGLVGGLATWFCCKKGFFKSLEDFSVHYSNLYKCHVCNDKKSIKHRGEMIPCPAGCFL